MLTEEFQGFPLLLYLEHYLEFQQWLFDSCHLPKMGLWWCASGKRGAVKNVRDLRGVTSDPASPWAVGLLRAGCGVHSIGLYQGD